MKKLIFVNMGMMMFRGGGENFDINMSKALHDLGVDVEIYSLQPVFRKTNFDSVPRHFGKCTLIRAPWLYPFTQWFHKTPGLSKLKGVRAIPRLIGQITFELRAYFKLRKLNESVVVHTCELPLLTYLLSTFSHHSAYMRMPGPLSNFYDTFLAKNSNGIIANGDAYSKIEKLHSIKPKLNYVEIGVYDFSKHELVSSGKQREAYSIDQNDFVVLYVGRLINIKNIPMLMEGFSLFKNKVPNSKLIIVGEGAQKQDLEILAKHLMIDKSIVFAGNIDKPELANFYNMADVFALTSHYDNFPNVMIEAMSFGLPCVGTNVGGIPNIIFNDSLGVVVSANDTYELSSAFSQCYETDFDRNYISSIISKKYSWNKSAKEYINLLQL